MRTEPDKRCPVWMTYTLWSAAIYNVVWGIWVVLFPDSIFILLGISLPNYPPLWQTVGMIVGVYGVGYACAAKQPARHWPIVLVGFLGKIFGPIGLLIAVLKGELPARFGYVCLTNDLIWWLPFALILLYALKNSEINTPT